MLWLMLWLGLADAADAADAAGACWPWRNTKIFSLQTGSSEAALDGCSARTAAMHASGAL